MSISEVKLANQENVAQKREQAPKPLPKRDEPLTVFSSELENAPCLEDNPSLKRKYIHAFVENERMQDDRYGKKLAKILTPIFTALGAAAGGPAGAILLGMWTLAASTNNRSDFYYNMNEYTMCRENGIKYFQ